MFTIPREIIMVSTMNSLLVALFALTPSSFRTRVALQTVNLAQVFMSDYSYRSATMGSTFIARRAGTQHADMPTTNISIAAKASAAGSAA